MLKLLRMLSTQNINTFFSGVVAEELIACTESVTNNEIYGRFFEIPPSSTSSGSMDVDLPKWLNGWMSKGTNSFEDLLCLYFCKFMNQIQIV